MKDKRVEFVIFGYNHKDFRRSVEMAEELGFHTTRHTVDINTFRRRVGPKVTEASKGGVMNLYRPIGGYDDFVEAYTAAEKEHRVAVASGKTIWTCSVSFFCDASQTRIVGWKGCSFFDKAVAFARRHKVPHITVTLKDKAAFHDHLQSIVGQGLGAGAYVKRHRTSPYIQLEQRICCPEVLEEMLMHKKCRYVMDCLHKE